MKKPSTSHIVAIGLAIFSMFFGAGNLMYPLKVGMTSGAGYIILGLIGFLATAVCLPLAGLIAMILFDGDYNAFFYRLSKPLGKVFIFIAMLIIGPVIALPRIVTLSHIMTAPFLPIPFLQDVTPISSFIFALIFLGITFLATYRENKIVHLLGYIISPLLLASLVIIMTKGFIFAHAPVESITSAWNAFFKNLIRGYETLDLLGGIFFSSIAISMLKNTLGSSSTPKERMTVALVGLKAGTLGVSLLGIVYIGMSVLGLFYGHGLELANLGELFRTIAFNIMGWGGALIIATAVLMACLSTSIALAAVVADYFQVHIFRKKINYLTSLILILVASLPLSTFGLGYVLRLTGGPITYVGYPVLITLTLCNIAYKLFGFQYVKIPVFIVFSATLISYLW